MEFSFSAFAGNGIVWVILALGTACYAVLLNCLLAPRGGEWQQRTAAWLKVLPVLLSALPLLGLLGTIDGLMATFRQMADAEGLDQQVFLSGGIADALLTTQLGLVLVVPGWLLLAWLKSHYRRGEEPIHEE